MSSEGDRPFGNPVDGLTTQQIREARGLVTKLEIICSSQNVVGKPNVDWTLLHRIQFSLRSLSDLLELAVNRVPTILDPDRPPEKPNILGNCKHERFEP